jgi:alpha-L-fucosidase
MKNKLIKMLVAGMLLSGGVMANDRDLDALQQEFLSWKFGMFMHFNMSTFVPGGWSTGQEDPLLFNPTEMDFGQWADAARSAKMKYGILTVKHTGGWCLWDTATSDRDISWFKNYKDGKGDMVKEFTDAFRARDLKVGLYYCFPLWGAADKWKGYQTLPVHDYAEATNDALGMIKAHFTELLSNYGPIDVIWIDQSNSPHGGLKEGDWRKVKAHMHSLQPNCIVIANNQMDFADSDIFGYEYPYSLELPAVGNTNPTEVCDKLNQGWFSSPTSPAVPVRTADYVVNKMLRPLNDNNANLLLNCAPDKRGILHEETVALLKQVGEMWDPNESSKAGTPLYGIFRESINKVPTADKKVALIFDASWTPEALTEAGQILDAHQADGTFFVNEATARNAKKELRSLVASGHALGNGSKDATVLTGMANARLVRNQVEPVQKQLNAVQSPTVFWAPELKYDDYTWSVLNYLQLVAIEPAVVIAETEIIGKLLAQLDNGSIIQITAAKQLEAVLHALESQGYDVVTVPALFTGSTSERLRNVMADGKIEVITGRE